MKMLLPLRFNIRQHVDGSSPNVWIFDTEIALANKQPSKITVKILTESIGLLAGTHGISFPVPP